MTTMKGYIITERQLSGLHYTKSWWSLLINAEQDEEDQEDEEKEEDKEEEEEEKEEENKEKEDKEE